MISKFHSTELNFFLNTLKPYRLLVILVIFSSVLGAVLDGISIGMLIPLISILQGNATDVQTPKMLQWLIDLLKLLPPQQKIYFAIGLVVLAMLLKNIFQTTGSKLGYWLSGKITADVRWQTIQSLMRVRIDFHHKAKIGDLLEKAINNTGQFEHLTRRVVDTSANLINFTMLFSLLIILSWQLTAITFILGAVFAFIVNSYSRALRQMSKDRAKSDRQLLNTFHESLSGIQLIKSYRKENEQLTRLKRRIESARKARFPLFYRIQSIHFLTDALGSIAIGALFLIALWLYDMNTKLLLTQLIPFVYILTRLIPITKFLNAGKGEILVMWQYVKLVHDLLKTDNKSFITDGGVTFSGLKREIRFQAVNFSYPGAKQFALSNIYFSIPVGKTTAIIGHSGSGKSTLVNLLLRFYDPQSGRMLVDGQSLSDLTLDSYRRKIGIVSQDTFIFNNTVRYNITFGAHRECAEEEIIMAAKKAAAHEFIVALPQGYDTHLGDRGINLSGGQRQRISIARTILNDPEILILDEATSALDNQTEKLVHEAITKISRNRTVIIIAHRLSTIAGADQVIVMKNGRVAEMGSTEQLFKQKGEYYHLVYSE